ncbi:MAG: hypothetical protein HY779_03985 [Rubrobacteridae bacterium]|nr:hypothetical protein [Rubrobacteridae bacterium]
MQFKLPQTEQNIEQTKNSKIKFKKIFKNKCIMIGAVVLSASLLIFTAGCDDDKTSSDSTGTTKESKVTTSTSEKKEEAKSQNWTIRVGGTQKANVGGLDITYEFHLNALKDGGVDAGGIYEGKATLKEDVDFSKISKQLGNVVKTSGEMGGTVADDNVRLTLTGASDLAPLVPEDKNASTTTTKSKGKQDDWDYAASGKFSMTGDAKLDLKATGMQGETAKYADKRSATAPIPYKLVITGEEVEVTIDKVGTFTGILSSYEDPTKK